MKKYSLKFIVLLLIVILFYSCTCKVDERCCLQCKRVKSEECIQCLDNIDNSTTATIDYTIGSTQIKILVSDILFNNVTRNSVEVTSSLVDLYEEENVDQFGFVWSKTENLPTLTDGKNDGFYIFEQPTYSPQTFTKLIDYLNENTVYYFRVLAKVNGKTGYSANSFQVHTAMDTIFGCTDPIALNYNENANTNDESCIYCINSTQTFNYELASVNVTAYDPNNGQSVALCTITQNKMFDCVNLELVNNNYTENIVSFNNTYGGIPISFDYKIEQFANSYYRSYNGHVSYLQPNTTFDAYTGNGTFYNVGVYGYLVSIESITYHW